MVKVYKPTIKKFLGHDVRVVNVNGKEYIILKDMFNCLGRLNGNNQISTGDRNKLNEFLKLLGKSCDIKKLTIDFCKKKDRGNKSNGSIQTVDCLLLERVPVALTQFEPINSNKRSAEENKRVSDIWIEFMKFVDKLLVEAKAYEFIVVDKKHQVNSTDRLQDLLPENEKSNPNNYKRLNNDIAYIIGHIIENRPIYKSEITSVANEETIDKLKLREEAMEIYLNNFELLEDFDQAKLATLKIMSKRYN